MKVDNENIFRDNYNGSEESLQAGLLALRKIGCAQVEAVKVLISQLDLSLQGGRCDSVKLHCLENRKRRYSKSKGRFRANTFE
jgi:hypothetical protein